MTKRALLAALIGCFYALAPVTQAADPPEQSFTAANGLTVKVKMVAPGNQPSSVQIICYLWHKPSGDRVIEALTDFDSNMGGIVQSLRWRGEFVGDERETLLFFPPKGGLKAESVLLIGLGNEADLSLDTMARVGTVALREAVRMKAASVSFAPALKDQGVAKLDAGEVAGAVMHSVILAYDTEKRLQKQGLAPEFSIREWTNEAGPAYFKSTSEHVQAAVAAADAEAALRGRMPYSTKQ